MWRNSSAGLRRLLIPVLIVAFLAPAWAFGQTASTADRRQFELQETLRQLRTTARLLHTTAHPDDEDGGMLTREARGRGVSVELLTLNRGEGGQNKTGRSLLDELGVLRTLELLAADEYYGVEQRFTRVADFGFSKTADETFEKWQGHDIALADMVRVIRSFRPDVIVSRFQGTSQDGHGHHQASGILTREAFRAAADPKRFPEQIAEGLAPWQAKKLYVEIPPEVSKLALDTGTVDPMLGASYVDYALRGLKHQMSQGADGWNVPPGPHVSYFKLADSVLPAGLTNPPEKDFFDGIDTSLTGLAARLGSEQSRVPYLKPALHRLEQHVRAATAAAEMSAEGAEGAPHRGPLQAWFCACRGGDLPGFGRCGLMNSPHLRKARRCGAPSDIGYQLLLGANETAALIKQVAHASLSASAKQDLLANLRGKRAQFQRGANLALGAEVNAVVDAPVAANADEAFVAVPGQSFKSTVTAVGPHPEITLRVPRGWRAKPTGALTRRPSGEVSQQFRVEVPPNAEITRPYWHRDDPERDAICKLDEPQYATLPFPPPPVQAVVRYQVRGHGGKAETTVSVRYLDQTGTEKIMPLAVAPALSVAVEPAMAVIPATSSAQDRLQAMVRNSSDAALRPELKPEVKIEAPQGWRADPAANEGREFVVTPSPLREERAQLNVVAVADGHRYAEGYTVVTRADLGAFPYYRPAVQQVSTVRVNTPPGLRVGYIMGAGDAIPEVLRQIGINVHELSASELAGGDLAKYDTIVLGIRAYDTRDDVRKNNSRLLEYVNSGGTLLVQYNSSLQEFNAGHYTPYPAELSRDRVTVEQAPVQMLAPDDPVFHFPNAITASDFDGWVQERGLDFMDQWDSHYQPLLASHDPGEPDLKGGLLRARYGKGVYIYTGYSFFRQLPAGVPGTIRLFVNLVSASSGP